MDKEEIEVRVGLQLKMQLKMQQFCAIQERSHYEVRNKMLQMGVFEQEAEAIIAKLIEDNFLNEQRFATAFTGGKFRIKKWGRMKIKAELKAHRVSDYSIKIAFSELDETEYLKTLREVLEKKAKYVKSNSERERNFKLAQYAISRGFESELIWGILGT